MVKKNVMSIMTARRFEVGTLVENLDVVITTAGQTKQCDESLPIKQSKQEWMQKLGLTDTSGHTWAILKMDSYNPMVKGGNIIIREATIDEFTNKDNAQERMLLIQKHEIPTAASEPETKQKAEGVIDSMVERILEKYGIDPIDALWPCTKTVKKTGVTKTTWVIYHRYCEQIAARAGIMFQDPEIIVNDVDGEEGKRTVVLLVRGQLGWVKEWSYGEASPKTTFLPYVFAIAEKRAKDRVILKLAGFHGMVYSDVEEDWTNDTK